MMSHVNQRFALSIVSYLIILFSTCYEINGQQSPCPNVFEYRYDGREIYGVITVPSVQGKNNLKVVYVVDGIYDTENSGELKLLEDDFTVTQQIQNGENIKYKLNFPNSVTDIPGILSIRFNKREYCNNKNARKPIQHTTLTIQTIVTFSQPDPIPIAPVTQQITQPISQSVSPPISLPISQPISPPISQPIIPQISQPISSPISQPISPQISQPISNPSVLFPQMPLLPASNNHNIKPSSGGFTTVLNDRSVWLRNEFKFSSVCGSKSSEFYTVQTIINGRQTEPGEFPWLAALINDEREYFCAGTLVSDKHVITAAHCLQNINSVFVELGKYNLKNTSEPDSRLRRSQQIINSPDYRPGTAHGDISIIILLEPVTITEKIKPACLWPFKSHSVGETGIISGWGIDINAIKTDLPFAAELNIVDDNTCRNSDDNFKNITSENTFCAGGNNKGPCFGDSGTGFVIGIKNRWYLKGVTSTSLSRSSNSHLCDVFKYAVYADVEKYLDWIKPYLLQ